MKNSAGGIWAMILIALILIASAAPQGFAQDQATELKERFASLDCEMWKDWPRDVRFTFVFGYFMGAALTSGTILRGDPHPFTSGTAGVWPQGYSMESTMVALNMLCEKRSNRAIPLVKAMVMISEEAACIQAKPTIPCNRNPLP